MNAIQQISLKLQLGIDPATRVRPATLRALWLTRTRTQRAGGRANQSSTGFNPAEPRSDR